MKDDPSIAAVRDARHLISEKVGHNPRKLVEYYQKLQQRHRDRLIGCPHKEAQEENPAEKTGA